MCRSSPEPGTDGKGSADRQAGQARIGQSELTPPVEILPGVAAGQREGQGDGPEQLDDVSDVICAEEDASCGSLWSRSCGGGRAGSPSSRV